MDKNLFNRMCAEYNLGINTMYTIIEGDTKLTVSNLTKTENHLRTGFRLSKQFFGKEIPEARKIKEQVKNIIKGFKPEFSFFGSKYKIISVEESKLQMKILDDLFEGEMSLNDYDLYQAACDYRNKF